MINDNTIPYLLIGASIGSNREATFLQLKQSTTKKLLCNDACVFDVPLNLKFGSFDDLIRTVDELPKHDTFCETNIRKIQRQALEISPNAELNIFWQGKSIPVDQYIRRFTWDNSRYPKTRYIRENLEFLTQSVSKLDENFRTKVAAWIDAKSRSSDILKKENVTLSQRDLIDIFNPSITDEKDFIETEHFTTVVIYVPRGLENDWKNKYEGLGEMVVPRSTGKFNIVDKEGGSLWRVLILKNKLEEFSLAAKELRFITRDFKYSKERYEDYVNTRTKLELEKQQQESFIARICSSTYSDLFIAWLHLKAMRLFCESVLRYGVPPNFSAFAFKPTSESKIKKLKKELDIFFTSGGYSDLYSKIGKSNLAKSIDNNTNEEEFLPFVSLSIQPYISL